MKKINHPFHFGEKASTILAALSFLAIIGLLTYLFVSGSLKS